jgi:hypothetical protein
MLSCCSIEDIQAALAPLNTRQLGILSALTRGKVGFSTLVKLRLGFSTNPRIETVRAFAPHIKAALAS